MTVFHLPPQGPAWCHANSSDLIHWDLLPIALPPFASTGGVVQLNASTFGAIYGTSSGALYFATSSDPELVNWEQDGVAIDGTQPGDTAVVWINNGAVSALVSTCNGNNCSASGVTPVFALFNGSSLSDLQFVSNVYVDSDVSGRAEFGDWFTLNGMDVLLFSSPSQQKVIWSVGSINAGAFEPLTTGVADLGFMYASASFTDEIGRRILFGLQKSVISS